MDIQTAITPMSSTQLLILWTLLGLLLAWMILFAMLAVLPEAKKKVKRKDVSVHSTAQPISVTASTKLQMVTTQPGNYMSTAVGSVNHETPLALEQSQ